MILKPSALFRHFRGMLNRVSQRGLHALVFPLATGFLCAVLAGVGSLFLQNSYISCARILPSDSKGGGSSTLAMAAAFAGMALPGQDGGEASFVDILQSYTLSKALLETQFTFREKKWVFGPELKITKTLASYLNCKNVDQGLKVLPKILDISRDPKTRLLIIKATTHSADLSQQIVMRVTERLNEFLVNKTQTRGGLKARYAEQRLIEAKASTAAAEQAFLRFAVDNRGYSGSPDPYVRIGGLRLENELKLRQQVMASLYLAYEQALMDEKNDIPILNVLDPGNLPIQKSAPSRASFVLLVFVMVSGILLILQNRVILKAYWVRLGETV